MYNCYGRKNKFEILRILLAWLNGVQAGWHFDLKRYCKVQM